LILFLINFTKKIFSRKVFSYIYKIQNSMNLMFKYLIKNKDILKTLVIFGFIFHIFEISLFYLSFSIFNLEFSISTFLILFAIFFVLDRLPIIRDIPGFSEILFATATIPFGFDFTFSFLTKFLLRFTGILSSGFNYIFSLIVFIIFFPILGSLFLYLSYITWTSNIETNLIIEKNYEFFFECLSELKENYKFRKFKVLMVGNQINNKNVDLINLIKKNNLSEEIQLLDEIEDMPKFYNRVDLNILTSSHGEAFPNVIAESMSCETPCLSTDIGDAKKIIGNYGWIVSQNNKEMFCNFILEIFNYKLNSFFFNRFITNNNCY